MKTDCILVFDSIHRVMKAEKILMAEGIDMRLIPTPRHISSDCGMVVQIHRSDAELVLSLLRDGDVEIAGVYDLEGQKGDVNVRRD